MTLLYVLTTGLVILWLSTVGLGLHGTHRGLPLLTGLMGLMVTLPFLPRLIHYVYDQEAFVTKFGAAAVSEIGISAVVVTLGVLALISAPFVGKRSWGWLVPALLTLFPIAFLIWLVCCFAIRF